LLSKPINNPNGVFSGKTCYTGVRSGYEREKHTQKKMEMQQMMEMLARMDANMKFNQEKAEIGHKELLANGLLRDGGTSRRRRADLSWQET
jgi:hypothetical protein